MENKDIATILIIDDKEANIFALEQLLEKNGRLFLHAADGSGGLKIALKKPVDLIILDVQMPGMDGFEVAQILKSNKKTRDIPIIFASAEKKEHRSIMKGFEEGAVDYLFKPLDPEITKAKVSVLLQIQKQKRELVDKNLSLEKSALLINTSADIIGIIDLVTLRFEEVNQAFTALLGYSHEEAIEKPISFFLCDQDKAIVSHLAQQPDEHLSFETLVYTKENQERSLQWRVVSRNKKWFVNVRDCTQQKIAERQIKQLNSELQQNLVELKATNKEMESFSYSVSHDLRAPLRALDGYSQILETNHQDKLDADAQRLLGVIRRNASRMGKLIDDLLEFSKFGRKELQKSEIDTQKLVEDIVRDLTDQVKHQAIIQIHSLPPVYADHSLLTQVWINLISNAIKYSSKKEKPSIEIGSGKLNEENYFYIKDNGTGFNMDYAHKLFGVFQRLHKSSDFEGTGVGLAIVERILTRHHGRIWAESKPGEGATFYFCLPEKE
jgi:PAS domain S-box-containing protein